MVVIEARMPRRRLGRIALALFWVVALIQASRFWDAVKDIPLALGRSLQANGAIATVTASMALSAVVDRLMDALGWILLVGVFALATRGRRVVLRLDVQPEPSLWERAQRVMVAKKFRAPAADAHAEAPSKP